MEWNDEENVFMCLNSTGQYNYGIENTRGWVLTIYIDELKYSKFNREYTLI